MIEFKLHDQLTVRVRRDGERLSFEERDYNGLWRMAGVAFYDERLGIVHSYTGRIAHSSYWTRHALKEVENQIAKGKL